MGIRWVIGTIMIFVLCTMISNVIEKEDLLTSGQVASMQNMTKQQFSESQDPDVGGVVTTGMNPLTVLQSIGKALFFDYAFFYNVDYTTTQAACTASGGTWQSATLSCKTPNEWSIVRYIFFWPLTVGMLFFMAITIWHGMNN